MAYDALFQTKMAKKNHPTSCLYMFVRPPSPGQQKIYTIVLYRQGCFIIFFTHNIRKC